MVCDANITRHSNGENRQLDADESEAVLRESDIAALADMEKQNMECHTKVLLRISSE